MLSKNKIFLLVGGMVVLALVALSPMPKLLAQSAGMAVSKYIWSDGMGWIDAANSGSQVTINSDTGVFSGYAWGDNIGWINMAGVSVPMTADGQPIGSVTGNAYACSVFASGCSGALKTSDQTGGWDGKISMQNVKINADKTFSGYAWSDLNTMWVNMSLLKFTLGPTNYILSVHKETGDTTGVTSVFPVNIDSSASYSPGTVMILTAKNLGANQPTCWRGCATTVTSDAKSSTYACKMDSNKDVFVGCGTNGSGTVTGGGTGNVAGNSCAGVTISGVGTYLKNTQVTLSASKGSDAIEGDWSSSPNTVLCTVTNSTGCTFMMPDPAENVLVNLSNCSVVPPSEITKVEIKTGIYDGIVFSKQGGSPYPWASQPFTVTVSPGDVAFDIGFDWASTDIPSGCRDAGDIKIIADLGVSSCSASTPVAPIDHNGNYRLCFKDRCANATTGYSQLNKTWTVGVTNNGESLTGVTGNTTKLKYSDATHQ